MTTPYQLLLDRIDAIRTSSGAPWTDDACGVTRLDTQISAFVHIDAYAVESSRHRVLLVGGQSGSEDDVEPVVAALERYATSQRVRNRVALSAIPCANPDGLNLGAGPGNGSGSNPSAGYPPDGGFFNHETDPETRYLWRYVGFMAPDFLVEVLSGDAASWEHSGIETPISRAMNAARMADDDSLLSALTSDLPNSLGQVQGLRLTAPASEVAKEIDRLLTRLMSEETPVISPAREDLAPSARKIRERDRRGARGAIRRYARSGRIHPGRRAQRQAQTRRAYGRSIHIRQRHSRPDSAVSVGREGVVRRVGDWVGSRRFDLVRRDVRGDRRRAIPRPPDLDGGAL